MLLVVKNRNITTYVRLNLFNDKLWVLVRRNHSPKKANFTIVAPSDRFDPILVAAL